MRSVNICWVWYIFHLHKTNSTVTAVELFTLCTQLWKRRQFCVHFWDSRLSVKTPWVLTIEDGWMLLCCGKQTKASSLSLCFLKKRAINSPASCQEWPSAGLGFDCFPLSPLGCRKSSIGIPFCTFIWTLGRKNSLCYSHFILKSSYNSTMI